MSTIQERIAALNLGQVGRVPGSPSADSQPRPAPAIARSNSADDQSSHTASQHAQVIGNQPNGNVSRPLPPPRPDTKRPPPPPARPSGQHAAKAKPPTLPSRQTQHSIARRDSQESVASTVSTRSSLSLGSSRTSTSIEPKALENGSRMKAPAYDAASLPALPPSRREQPPAPNRPSLPNRKSSSTKSQPLLSKFTSNKTTAATTTTTTTTTATTTTPQPRFIAPAPSPNTATPGLPPRAPLRTRAQEPVVTEEPAPRLVPRPSPQPDVQAKPAPVRRSALSFGMNSSTEETPAIPSRPVAERSTQPGGMSGAPPPIPLGSRPDLAALQASKPKMNSSGAYATPASSVGANATSCLECRDFSGPDSHVTRFPRQGLPTEDLAWLGQQLTKPFDSPTDKARAIFTWLHHNVAYNVDAFFSGNLKASTPASTISSGLAVCEGYAALFAALATHAGLEAVVVGGHGKGFGYTEGSPVPTGGPTGHAWNAVKIDNGEWKLCDPCWGAGHVTAERTYGKSFNPSQFIMSNDEFGKSHFPENPRFFFVASPPTFAQYWRGSDGPGEEVVFNGGVQEKHGIGKKTVLPRKRDIHVRTMAAGSKVLFRFSTPCDHWDHRAKGTWPPSVYTLHVGGRDGRKADTVPFKHDAAFKHWWLELPVEELGCAGQEVMACNVATIDGQNARGKSVRDYLDAKGRKSMSWNSIAMWKLV